MITLDRNGTILSHTAAAERLLGDLDGLHPAWLALYASLTESSACRPGETFVVIEPAKLEEVAWLNVPSYGLSPREEEVVKLVARGQSTEQLFRTVYIAEYTVQRPCETRSRRWGWGAGASSSSACSSRAS